MNLIKYMAMPDLKDHLAQNYCMANRRRDFLPMISAYRKETMMIVAQARLECCTTIPFLHQAYAQHAKVSLFPKSK
jgi:hypothetical protein